ncbi:MAG: tetratricopeptide repeat protein [Leptolyngbya sp. SIO4C1]|nr:tetratricopeptide repeat protein [Leptolyngbya sp. SIO4C1]
MQDLVASALQHQDFQRAAQLLKKWKKASPKDPLMLLYAAKLQESTLQFDAAERTYLKFLKLVNSPKLMGQARDGLRRVQQQRAALRQQDLEEAKAVLGSEEPGVLLLAPPRDRKAAAQGLAQVMQTDPYTASLQIPSRGLRLQRIGPVGELQYYGKSLQQALPTYWTTIEAVKAVKTFQAKFFEALRPQPRVVCQNAAGQLGQIQFDWSEVTQRVSAQLPIFEQVADIGAWGKRLRKEQTQDYAQVLDLHLHGRQIILRLCDRTYEFTKSAPLLPDSPESQLQRTTRIRWNALLQQIEAASQSPLLSDFTSFGQGALEFIDLLPYVNPHLDIDRRAPSNWDQAFHLYSALVFLMAASRQGAKA